MQNRVIEFLMGLLFGIGLLISGMTDPGKVQGFLDVFGLWDPSLALVMGGAIAVGTVAFYFAKQRSHTYLGEVMQLPVTQKIDRRLVLGSLLFGAGWGLAGYCPGPAMVSLGSIFALNGTHTGGTEALIFVLAMLLGMGLYEMMERRRRSRSAALS